MMKKYIAIASLVLGFGAAWGQDDSAAGIIEQIESAGNIRVNVPEGLLPVLTYHASDEAPEPEESAEHPKSKVGYRVQVFDDNNPRTAKAQAEERCRMIESKFPEFRAYVQFNSPYWRVKVGDFRTRSEAEAAMGAIRGAFPQIGSQLRVVRDKINVR